MMTRSRGTGGLVAGLTRSGGLGLALGMMASTAWAGPGDHIRLGTEGELTPRLAVGMEFQSNPFLVEGNNSDPEHTRVSGFALVAKPGLDFKWSSQALEFDLSAGLEARGYLNAAARNLSRFSDSNLAANLNVLPKAVVGAVVVDEYRLENRPSEARFAGTTDKNSDGRPFITQIHNNVDGYVSIHPGGSLTVDVGGTFVIDDFRSNPNSNSLGEAYLNNRYMYGPQANVRWAFFPKTALQGSASVAKIDWDRNSINTAEGDTIEFTDPRLAMPDALSWRVEAGLVGRFTKKLVLNAMVGYGQLRYDTDSVLESLNDNIPYADTLNPDTQGWGDASVNTFGEGLLATAKMTWAPRKNQSFSLGYIKDYEDSWFTNYLGYHYGFLSYEGNLSRRLQVRTATGYRLETYRGHLNRQDQVITVDAAVSYTLQKWAVVTLDAGWKRRVSAQLLGDVAQASREFDNFPVGLTVKFIY